MAERCPECAPPFTRHKLKILRGTFDRSRWYVYCQNENCPRSIMPLSPDGWFGVQHWRTALLIGIRHQLEAMKP